MNKHIGIRLRSVRRRLGYSQREVADMIGLHRPAVTLIEQGVKPLMLYQLLLFIDKAGITVADFFAWDGFNNA